MHIEFTIPEWLMGIFYFLGALAGLGFGFMIAQFIRMWWNFRP